MQTIGKRLAEIRKSKKYKQTELAEMLNVSQQVISNIERGVTAPDIEQLKKFADIYNISLDQLVGREFFGDDADDVESTPALGILEYKTVTTASSVYELEGFSAQVGGSKLFPIQEGCPIWGMAGGDLVFIGNPNNGRPGAIGITSSGGIGIGEGVEFHAQMGQTTTFYSINLFDLWDGIYDKKKSR